MNRFSDHQTMANNYPFRFNRVTAALAEVNARTRFCDRIDDHFADNSPELSDLINSFIERNEDEEDEDEEEEEKFKQTKSSEKTKYRFDDNSSESYWSISETKEMLQNLLGVSISGTEDAIKQTIRAETELASRFIETNSSSSSSEGFKRLLVNRLRDRGFDAGLCQTCWDKMSGFSAGDYEYIDIFTDGTRYIIEVALAGEFSIARPTNRYLSLLAEFPQIFVGKPEELKQVVKLMCLAAKDSMKSNNMHLPPWRRNGYMEAKWFGSHKRLTEGVVSEKASDSGSNKSEGIEASPPAIYHYYCRGEVAGKAGLRVGKLALAFNGNGN